VGDAAFLSKQIWLIFAWDDTPRELYIRNRLVVAQTRWRFWAMQLINRHLVLVDTNSITLRLTHEEFERLCEDNPEQSFELTKDGELEIMLPVSGESGNSDLAAFSTSWFRGGGAAPKPAF
jgi:hypothetical protein